MTERRTMPALPSVLAISEDGYSRLMAAMRSGVWDDGHEEKPDPYTLAHGVARVKLHGPLMASADWLDRICGATTYGEFAAALNAAHADPRAQAVLIDVDSPGGDVKGMHEAAMAVRALRGQGKPLVTYASGAMCSAGYGVGCQTDRIYASPSAIVGCLGTICVGYDDTKFMESLGVTRHVTRSAETPNKAPLPGSPEYEAEAQRLADDTAAVLFADVGAARGVNPADVPEKYGRGAVFVGAAALAAGLVDAIAGPDDSWLYAGGTPPLTLTNPGGVRASQEDPMPLDANAPRAGVSDASATAGTPPDTSGSRAVATVTISASEHQELLRLRAEQGQFEQAQKDAQAARLLAAANADALKAAQQAAADAQAQAADTAKHVAEMRKATALADADRMLAGHATRGGINAAMRTKAMDALKALPTAEAISAKAAEQNDLFGMNPDGAARPVRTSGRDTPIPSDAAPQNANDVTAKAHEIRAAEEAAGRPCTFGRAWAMACAQHPDAARTPATQEVRA